MDNTFDLLSEAAELAATRCTKWQFMYSNETYDIALLKAMAEVDDEENPLDEDSYYIVSVEGAIGQMEEDNESIDWLFVPVGFDGTPTLPENNKPTSRYCTNCGSSLVPDASFCQKCGTRL